LDNGFTQFPLLSLSPVAPSWLRISTSYWR